MNDLNFRKQAFKAVVKQFEKQNQKERGTRASIAHSLGLSRSAVTSWEKKGIPRSRIPYFKLIFPKLTIWK